MKDIQLGLKENWQQFTLLVFVNMMVGGMVGLERTIVPLIGKEDFHLSSELFIFSFIIAFGVIKALTNLISGALADKYTRRKLLIAGWLVGLPVPFLLAWAPTWNWILFSNILLGASQGLAWSMTVNMKIDLVGPKKRGLAMGINEASGYSAIGLTALITGYIATNYGLRPEPFYLGIAYTVLGLLLSIFVVKDTRKHTQLESFQIKTKDSIKNPHKPSFPWVFKETSIKNKNLFSISQAGLINNLNDGMAWGVFPILFISLGVHLEGVGWIKGIYPLVWGLGQIITGPLSDRVGRKPLIVWGMIIQSVGFGIIGLELFEPLISGLTGAVFMGIGTAMVYPSLLAAVSDVAHPNWRASSLGVYRFWRDLGYAIGALLAGILGTYFGLFTTINIVAVITLLSGLVVWVKLNENNSI